MSISTEELLTRHPAPETPPAPDTLGDFDTNDEAPFVTTQSHAASDPFRLLVESVKDYGIFMLDPAGNVFSWNPGAEKSKGYKAAEIIGRHFSCFYSAEDVAADKPQHGLQIALEEGRFEEEGLRLRNGGSPFWAIVTITSIMDSLGRHIGFANVTRDITERKQAEEMLHERAVLASLTADVGLAFTRGGSQRAPLQACAESMVSNLGAAFARIWTLNEAEKVLELEASAGLYTHLDGAHSRVPVGKFKIGLIAEEKKPHLTNDVAHDARIGDPDWAKREGMVAFAGYPLLLEDRLVGVMAMFARKRLTDTTLQAMASIANQIALGIERKQGEETLRIAEARKAAILEASLDAVVSMDHHGKILGFNAAAERIFGFTDAEAVGQPLAELIIPRPLRALHYEGFARYVAGGPSSVLNKRLEVPALRKDGSEFPIELTITRIRSEGPPIFTAFLRDITERKQAERRVLAQHAVTRVLSVAASLPEASAQILQSLCESLDWDLGAVWQVDHTAQLLRCVQTWRQPAAQLGEFEAVSMQSTFARGVGLPGRVWASGQAAWIADVFTDANFPRAPFAVKAGLHGAFGFPIILGNETLAVLEFFSQELRQPDEDILEMMTAVGSQIGQFIERKLAADSHRASEERIRLLLDSAVEPIYGIDMQGNCTFCNAACARLLGYADPGRLIGKNMHTLIHHTRADGTPYPVEECRIYLAFRQGQGSHVDDELFWRADGTSFPAEYWSNPIRREGQVVGSVVSFLDITDRRKLEDQFHQVQKMEAVGQLAGGVAHDFNNLLTIISGYSELLLGTLPPDDPKREAIKAISEAGERAAALTRQLLSFSRQAMLETKVLDLNTVMREMEKLLRRMIGEDILLTAVLDPNISRIKVDPGQMGQVLMNLAVNARDAMPQGGKLTMETSNIQLDEAYAAQHADCKPGRYVKLTISDNGCGMTPEVKAHIFEPFFTTKGPGKGTGLGLATVYGIVKQSGGVINLYTEIGHGTTFKIYLPAIDEPPRPLSEDQRAAKVTGGTETVLLVEDEDAVRAIGLLALQTHGYTLLQAESGKKALGIIAKHAGRIDLLVTDVVMPGLSGRELAETLVVKYPGLKVLYVSGYTDDTVIRHGILQAEVAFLQKPYTPLSLARKVRQVLDKQ